MTKPPQINLFTNSSGAGMQAMFRPKPYRSLYFGLKPINCLRRDSCKSIPSCNCPGEEGKFQSVRVCIRCTLKGVGSGTPVPSTSLRQLLVNCDQVIVYFIEEGQRGLLPPFLELWPLGLI